MKIKSSRDNNIVYGNLSDIPEVKLSPEIKSNKDYDKYDFLMGYLLTTLDSFTSDIKNIRSDLEIKKILRYPRKNNLQELYDLLFSLGVYKYKLSNSSAIRICKKYKLQANWKLPILSVIYTNTLLIPKRLDSIYLNIGSEKKYPSIEFTAKTSTNELKKWIGKNKYLIELAQKDLPVKRKPKVDPTTLVWGHIVWIIRKSGVKSWTKISEKIDRKFRESENEVFEIYGKTEAPIPSELQKYYTRFLDSLGNSIK